MNLRLVAGSAMILSMLLASCGSPPTTTTQPPGDPDALMSAQATVYALAAAQPSGNIPTHFRTDDPRDVVRNPDDFDVNTYFNVLTGLSVESGWVIDYLYQMDGLGGGPFIYARPADQAPYASFDEYVAATAGGGNASSDKDHSREYLSHIKIDDNLEGYFQFVALMTMADQFYLYWHAGYNDTTIVADKDALEKTMAAAGSAFEGDGLPASVQRQARRLDLTPTVESREDRTVLVRVVTFSMWGGFAESRYTISREFPHIIISEETKTLIEYDCGVRF